MPPVRRFHGEQEVIMIRFAAGASTALLALSLVSGSATAENQLDQISAEDVQVGVGVVCDTDMQIKRFATLSEQAGDVKQAINTVNTEAKNPAACAQVVAAFVRGKDVAEVHRAHDSLTVAEITILAVPEGNQWQMVSPVKQYTAFPVKGIDI